MNIAKIINFKELAGITDIVDFNEGRLKHNGKTYDVCAVIVDKLSPAKIEEISAYKNVVHIGTCYHKYAPEIEYNVIYIKN